MEFKDDSVAVEWQSRRLNPRLIVIVLALAAYALERWHVTITITDIYRPKTNDSGVHAVWRGVDVRTRDWTPEMSLDILRWLNESFCYDESRPEKMVAMIHDVGQGVHLHLQVSYRTGKWV